MCARSVSDDVALHRRQLACDLLDDRHEGRVEEDDLVFGVIDDPGDLLGEQARVQRVQTAPMPMAPYQTSMWRVGVPGQRRDAVAGLDAALPAARWRACLARRQMLAVGGARDRPLDGAGHDLAAREIGLRRGRGSCRPSAASPASARASAAPPSCAGLRRCSGARLTPLAIMRDAQRRREVRDRAGALVQGSPGAARVNTSRSCNRNGRSRQNSICSGTEPIAAPNAADAAPRRGRT